MIHHRRRVDANQAEIVAALQKIGCCIMDLSGSGKGVCDLIVMRAGRFWMVEVKNLKGRGDMLTPAQIKMHQAIADVGCEVHVIRTVDEALALVMT
jgi:Holliday junction resolvase